jgi:hypothetical protein
MKSGLPSRALCRMTDGKQESKQIARDTLRPSKGTVTARVPAAWIRRSSANGFRFQ